LRTRIKRLFEVTCDTQIVSTWRTIEAVKTFERQASVVQLFGLCRPIIKAFSYDWGGIVIILAQNLSKMIPTENFHELKAQQVQSLINSHR
jgi:hypothetical protein